MFGQHRLIGQVPVGDHPKPPGPGQQARGGDYLVVERGYWRRQELCSLGFNGLHGEADYTHWNDGGARWRQHGVPLRPWADRKDGYVLIMGQVAGDASLGGLDVVAWVSETAPAIADMTGCDAWFRPHPGARQVMPEGVKVRPFAESLEAALAGARMVVTWSSTSGVDAALCGVPVVALSPVSMARDVAAHELVPWPPMPDRTMWTHRLARRQWTLAELANGEAWEHLRRRYEGAA